ncbi:hypothetical protein BDN71DRAFT_1509725 [Pleurotus eryngii]|uniref:Uncharacterized protein n=1 Tax=Pleurotus eryngii TaxID=5323 RepID=A0A9P6D4D6_PLEER|nr:hypothetical protein BDN71DRAFT_1509725 [Pleurotus eryngii]
MPTIDNLPEELIERILHQCVSSPPFPPARPAWHRDHQQQREQIHDQQQGGGQQFQPLGSQTLPSLFTAPRDQNPNLKGKHRKLSSPPPATATRFNTPTITNAYINKAKTEKIRTRLAPLLVCRLFNRIATPAFYETILLRSEWQAGALAWSLRSSDVYTESGSCECDQCATKPFNTSLHKHIKSLIILGCFESAAVVLRMCAVGLRTLDLTITGTGGKGTGEGAGAEHVSCLSRVSQPTSASRSSQVEPIKQSREATAKSLSESLANLRSIAHLVLRKAQTVYLTQGSVKAILGGVADGIMKWEELETVYIAFRLSDDSLGSFSTPPFTSTSPPSTASPVLPSPGASTLLANALISSPSPNFHTLITLVPSVWNSLLKRVVEGRAHPPSTSLGRLVLVDGSTTPLFDLGMWGAGTGFSCGGRVGVGISFGEEDDDDDNVYVDSNMVSPSMYPCSPFFSPTPYSPSSALSPTFPSSPFSPTLSSPLSPSLTTSPAASLYLNEAQNHAMLADAIRAGTRWLRRRSVLQAGAASSCNVGTGVGAYGMTGYRARAYTMGSTATGV